ncbi:MAG: MucB/RseB C-terminal domain-containing protein [Pigmentiphaga sp.]|nr:MucB/RseB C-terminal domain-containing protein [Pigmentiphaga sp.]
MPQLAINAAVPRLRWLARAAVLVLAVPLHTLAAEPTPAEGLLARVQDAAHKLDYAGTFMYQLGSNLVASHIVHQASPDGGRERIEVLDGPKQREFVRENKVVYSLLPERQLVLVEARETDHFPGMITGNPQALEALYEVALLDEPGRVAGRPCRNAQVVPRDAWRWGYRLCIDDASGLLLKVQTLDADGAILEQAAFSEITVGDAFDPAWLESSHPWREWPRVQGGREFDLAAAGWHISAPEGFEPISQIKRKLKGRAQVYQMVLTDGMAAISVFIEPYDPSLGQSDSMTAYGATSIYRGRKGEHWLTVLGEVPPRTVRAVADAIAR